MTVPVGHWVWWPAWRWVLCALWLSRECPSGTSGGRRQAAPEAGLAEGPEPGGVAGESDRGGKAMSGRAAPGRPPASTCCPETPHRGLCGRPLGLRDPFLGCPLNSAAVLEDWVSSKALKPHGPFAAESPRPQPHRPELSASSLGFAHPVSLFSSPPLREFIPLQIRSRTEPADLVTCALGDSATRERRARGKCRDGG